jgi:hypothetical protein
VSGSISLYIWLLPLASAHILQFAGILEVEVSMNDVSAPNCLGALTHSLSVEMRAILQHVSPTKQIPLT